MSWITLSYLPVTSGFIIAHPVYLVDDILDVGDILLVFQAVLLQAVRVGPVHLADRDGAAAAVGLELVVAAVVPGAKLNNNDVINYDS